MRFLLYSGLLTLFCACHDNRSPQQKKYFSVSAFLQEEIAGHKKNKTALLKSIHQNGVVESKRIAFPAWEQELKPFFDSDLDKPARKNMYRADTLIRGANSICTYTCTEKSCPVKLLRVYRSGMQIDSVIIRMEITNAWFTNKQELRYLSRKGFFIKSEQTMTLARDTRFEISATFQENSTSFHSKE